MKIGCYLLVSTLIIQGLMVGGTASAKEYYSAERSKGVARAHYRPDGNPVDPKYFNTLENDQALLNIRKEIPFGKVFSVEFADYRASAYEKGKYNAGGWIGVYQTGADHQNYIAYNYISKSGFGVEGFAQKYEDSRHADNAWLRFWYGKRSSYPITHAPISSPGRYEIRIFGDGGYGNLLATVQFLVKDKSKNK